MNIQKGDRVLVNVAPFIASARGSGTRCHAKSSKLTARVFESPRSFLAAKWMCGSRTAGLIECSRSENWSANPVPHSTPIHVAAASCRSFPHHTTHQFP